MNVRVDEAQKHFNRLIELALAGGEVAIVSESGAAVRLTVVAEPPKPPFAALRGSVPGLRILGDFDELPNEIRRTFGCTD